MRFGLYDTKKSHAPVLAICGQVPLAELGLDFFQEVDNDVLFADVAAFCRTLTSPEQLRGMLEQAVQSALGTPGVAVLTMPGEMPASLTAERLAGLHQRADFDNSAPVAHAHLPWLDDVIPWPGPLPNVLSVGDLLIFAGTLVLLHRACGPAPRPVGPVPVALADEASTQLAGGGGGVSSVG